MDAAPAVRKPMPTIPSLDDWDQPENAVRLQASLKPGAAAPAEVPLVRIAPSMPSSAQPPVPSEPAATDAPAHGPAILPPPVLPVTLPADTGAVQPILSRHPSPHGSSSAVGPALDPSATGKDKAPGVVSAGQLSRQNSWGSTCSSILPYRPSQRPSGMQGPQPSMKPNGERDPGPTNDELRSREEEEAKTLTDKAYDLTIGAGGLLGGFTIKEVLAAPDPGLFSHDWAFYIYRLLLPFAAALDLYAVMSLVLNRYLAARAFKDFDRLAHAEFLASTAPDRRRAVWAFLLSLPIFLVAAAAKQLHGMSAMAAAGPMLVLVLGCAVIFYSIRQQTRMLETVLAGRTDAVDAAKKLVDAAKATAPAPGPAVAPRKGTSPQLSPAQTALTPKEVLNSIKVPPPPPARHQSSGATGARPTTLH